MLEVPYKGLSEWLIHRPSFSQTFEIILSDEPLDHILESALRRNFETYKDLIRSYVFEDPYDLRIWLRRQMLPEHLVNSIIDYATNWILIHFNCKTQKFCIPEYQDHPIEPNADPTSFRVSRPTDKIDHFDPLQEIEARRKQ